MSMTSSRFWLGLRKSQLPATQWLLHAPSETAALFPVSKTASPFGWSMTHMLIGIVMSRALSFGSDGISPWMLNGPNMPLVVQYTLTPGVPAGRLGFGPSGFGSFDSSGFEPVAGFSTSMILGGV